MANTFTPRLDILPMPQRALWLELRAVPKHFTLYGGTALALRIGHRQSIDFDFFSAASFAPSALKTSMAFLSGADIQQSAPNSLTCVVDRDGPIQVSFFGGLKLQPALPPGEAVDNGIRVASMLDIAASKVKVILDRASAKDYFDIDALLSHGISLVTALNAACDVYGPDYQPLLSLKALAYYNDGDLPTLPKETIHRLTEAARAVSVDQLKSARSTARPP